MKKRVIQLIQHLILFLNLHVAFCTLAPFQILDDSDYTPDKIPVHCGRNVFDDQWTRLFYPVKLTSSHALSKRIVGGTISKYGEWPWLTSLIFHQNAEQVRRQRAAEREERLRNRSAPDLVGDEDDEEVTFVPPTVVIPEPDGGRKFHMCGGTLIHPRWVLSAAHCFMRHPKYPDLAPIPERWTIRVGEHDMLNESVPHYDMEVDLIVTHPDYSTENYSYDVALLKLRRPVPRTRYVNIACLPAEQEQLEAGQVCYSVGWGHEVTTAKNISTILRHVALPIVSNEHCQNSYDSLRQLEPSFVVHIMDTMVCAGEVSGGRDACQFDSGGPLMCKHGTQWRVEGIISFGFNCGTHIPGVYMRVANLIPWIKDVVNIL